MPTFYRITGLGGGFDGLIAEVNDRAERSSCDGVPVLLYEVSRLHRSTEIMGDRHVALPLPARALYIESLYLSEEAEDPRSREYATTHDYGWFIEEGTWSTGQPVDVVLRFARFEHRMQVSVVDALGRTKFSGYFPARLHERALAEISRFSVAPDEVIFALRALLAEAA